MNNIKDFVKSVEINLIKLGYVKGANGWEKPEKVTLHEDFEEAKAKLKKRSTYFMSREDFINHLVDCVVEGREDYLNDLDLYLEYANVK